MRAGRQPGLRGDRRLGLTLLAAAVGWAGPAARDGAAQNLPYTLDEVVRIVSSGVVPETRIASLVRERCIAFRADEPAVTQLRRAGAGPELVRALRAACRILPGEPRELRIEPDTVALQVGERLTLRARGTAPDGKALDGFPVRWSSQDPRVAAVDGEGRVGALAPGMTRVEARAANEVRAIVRVWVRPAPAATALSPRTALLVGALVPGAGQFYTNQPEKGLLVFGGVAALLTAGFAVQDGGDRPLLVPGLLVAGGLWAYGAADARRRAEGRDAAGPARSGSAWVALDLPEPEASGGVRITLLRFRY